MYSSTIFKLCSLVGLVAAHGFMQDVTVDGTKYPGSNGAAANPSKSPIRQLNNDPNDGTPIFDPSSSDMGCGIKSSPVSTVVNVKPGSKIATHWQGPTNIPWFHDTGPVLTYMAACEGSCSTFQPTASTKWFKIDQLTEKQPGTPNTWYQADMNSGAAITVTLPTGLASGGYLYRQEVIALQNGQTKGAAEYYPSCIQMNVVGGASTMNPSPTVNFPGAYSETDPGVFGNFYNPGVVYVAPGGPVATLNGSGKSTASTPSAPPANAAPAPPAAPKPAAPAASSKPAAAKPAPSSAPAAKAPAAPAPAAPSPAPASSSQCNKRKRSAAAQAAKKSIRSSHFKRRLASTH